MNNAQNESAAYDRCLDAMRRHWGMDDETEAARAKWTPRCCPVSPRQSRPASRPDVDVDYRSH